MLLTLQALWILLFSSIGRTFFIKSTLSRMIHSIWLKTKFEVLGIPTEILAFRSCQTWYIVARNSVYEKNWRNSCHAKWQWPIESIHPSLLSFLECCICHKHPTRSLYIGAFKEQVVVIFIVAKTEWACIGTMYTKPMKSILSCEFLLDSHP
jgi:hypothetical protein